MKKYLVTGTFQYEVEAENYDEAIEKASSEYMETPETDYVVEEAVLEDGEFNGEWQEIDAENKAVK